MWTLTTLPLAIIMGENHSNLFKAPPNKVQYLSGTLLRILWLFSAMIITMAFAATLRAILIKKGSPFLLTKLSEVIQSERPIIFITFSMEDYEQMRTSPALIDKYIYDKSVKVYPFTR